MPSGEASSTRSVSELLQGFQAPPPDTRPMMRWWWFGPNVEQAEIDRELQAMAAAGIGGVEVAYVYPMTAESPALMSPEFFGHLHYAALRARELGLRFDLTLGSGWSYGGPHISTDLAASMLHWDRRQIFPGAFTFEPDASFPGDQLLAAFLGGVERPTEFVELPISDGEIRVPDGSGPRQLLIAFARPTGQVVKRAAAGADGPVLDHFSAAATQVHIDHVAEPLLQAVPGELIGSVFCDSLEVYGANWTSALPTQFERRRGYPLRPRLYELIIETPDSDQLRIDYYRTLTELYEENFVVPLQQWAAGHGVPFRIQGYGTPPAGISSYRYADLCEGEGWGWKEITQTRWASSAAHLLDRPVVSSETWTWNHSPSFRSTALDLKGEAHEHLLAGINQFIGHGWPYSPPEARDAGGLGWYFYAAGCFDDRNPWWPAMPSLTAYLQRLSWLMRQGRPVADVLVYVPQEDIYPRLGREAGGTLDLWKETRRTVDPAVIATIREGGWDYDLVDDALLGTLDVDHASVLVLAQTHRIPDGTRDWLDRYRAAGGTVLAVDSAGYPAVQQSSTAALADELARAIAPDLKLDNDSGDIGAVHRQLPDTDLYLLINTGPSEQRCAATPRAQRRRYEVWDPDHAQVIAAGDFAGSVDLDLDPYQAAVLVLTDDDHDVEPATAAPAEVEQQLSHGWTASFDDHPEVSVELPHRWEGDTDLETYSGTVTYRVSVDLDHDWTSGDRVFLDFGRSDPRSAGADEAVGIRSNSYRVDLQTPVGEVARVVVNDRDAGIAWAPPYRVEITEALREGRNEIRVEVSNTAAHALAGDTAIAEIVEESRKHWGERFTMQDLDLALDGVSSGLLGVPILRR